MKGCNNVHIRAPESINNTKRMNMSCDGYGCYDLEIYSINSITSDINFYPSNCPCDKDIQTACINECKLHCGKYYNESANIFKAASCKGPCCGDIETDFHEYYCPVAYECNANENCIVNCKNKTSLGVCHVLIMVKVVQ